MHLDTRTERRYTTIDVDDDVDEDDVDVDQLKIKNETDRFTDLGKLNLPMVFRI